MARVTRHQRPHVGSVGWVGTGKTSLRTSSSAAAATSAARSPATPSPTRPAQSATATASPSHPAQPCSAPNRMKKAVAISCQTMFWNASSPAIHPETKLRTVKGSRRIGR